MKIKFIPNHTLTALLKTIVFIAIVSGVFFGLNKLFRLFAGDMLMIEYSIMMAFSAIFLHFYKKEEK